MKLDQLVLTSHHPRHYRYRIQDKQILTNIAIEHKLRFLQTLSFEDNNQFTQPVGRFVIYCYI